MALSDLFKPRWKHSNPDVREKNVKKITDQSILIEIAKTDKNSRIRGLAIEKIKDKDTLIDIAKFSTDEDNCRKAITRITDKRVLKKILKTPAGWYCKKAIIEKCSGIRMDVHTINKIEDNDFLSIISRESINPEERKFARIEIIKRIEDDFELAQIVNKSENTFEKYVAFECIKDQNLWAQIFLSNPKEYGKYIETAFRKITDEKLLDELAHASISLLSYYEAKKRINHCPLCGSKDLFWDEQKYTVRESGPADSFYRETMTIESDETEYNLICKSCNSILLKGDTGA